MYKRRYTAAHLQPTLPLASAKCLCVGERFHPPKLQEFHLQTFDSNPTTGFLTATTFIYALRAGITAAAGTRLALE